MKGLLRRLRGVLGVGLGWTGLGIAVGAGLGAQTHDLLPETRTHP